MGFEGVLVALGTIFARSIAGLAKEAGLSKNGLFAHFKSKEDLQLQVLENAVERFIEIVVAPALRRPRGEPRVRAMFDNWMSWEDSSSMPGQTFFTNRDSA